MDAKKGDLRAVKELHEIREKLAGTEHTNEGLAAVAGEAEEDEAHDERPDPLDEIATPMRKAKGRPKGAAKGRTRPLPTRASVETVLMPKRPPCIGVGQDETVRIHIYRPEGSKRKILICGRITSLGC